MLTHWLETAPHGFELGDECELKEPVDKGGVMRGSASTSAVPR
ncbi:MAG: recombination-associated protein RdgC [Chromatiaceae bacterium]|nr:recombination-associated protein RdgC [Chromatiaceae bacterium]